MEVTVVLKTCYDCHHKDHSGSFTVRGARLICGHFDACKERVSLKKFRAEYPEYADRDLNYNEYHWIHRVLTKDNNEKLKKIPSWCPLKHGSKY